MNNVMNNAINNTISFMKFVLRGCLCLGILFPLYAQGKEFQILNIEAETTKHMASDPRRIARIESHIRIELNPEADDRAREGLKRIVPLCPVSRSLHPDVIKDVTVTFI